MATKHFKFVAPLIFQSDSAILERTDWLLDMETLVVHAGSIMYSSLLLAVTCSQGLQPLPTN